MDSLIDVQFIFLFFQTKILLMNIKNFFLIIKKQENLLLKVA
nr:MAG TPA: hypothetical protein [Caudoviricetes sp.]